MGFGEPGFGESGFGESGLNPEPEPITDSVAPVNIHSSRFVPSQFPPHCKPTIRKPCCC